MEAAALKSLDWTMGDRMWKARKTAGLEQSDVAKALDVSRALVSRWERDLSEPSPSQLRKFVELIKRPDVTVASLIEGTTFGYKPNGAETTFGTTTLTDVSRKGRRKNRVQTRTLNLPGLFTAPT